MVTPQTTHWQRLVVRVLCSYYGMSCSIFGMSSKLSPWPLFPERRGMLPDTTATARQHHQAHSTAHRQRLIVRLLGSSRGLGPFWWGGHLVVYAGSEGLQHVSPSGVWQAANGWVTLRGPGRVACACLYAAVWLPLLGNIEASCS